MNDVSEMTKASLAYEKAYTLADRAQRKASNGRAMDLEPGDGARFFYDDLDELKKKYRRGADVGWALVKAQVNVTDEPYENIANAIIERAVLDYEIALSNDDKIEQATIEKFAAGDFCYALTKLDMTEQLAIVKSKATLFFKLIQKNSREISKESAALRRAGKPVAELSKYRCPLCGGHIYESARPRHKRKEYHCGGCALVGWAP